MKTIATSTPVEDCQSRWLTWRIAVPILTLLFILYPAVMPPPPHEGMVALPLLTTTVPVRVRGADTCPPMGLCPDSAVEQALPRLPVPPALLLAFVVVILAVRWQPRPLPTRHGWWWPTDRRRALIQIFLI
jgi:hypothetical protein